MRTHRFLLPAVGAYLCLLVGSVFCADWPMWRCDTSRSASTPDSLPEQLELQWLRELPPYELAWPNEPRLHFDACYEPVVMGKRLFFGSPMDGSVRAFDTESGAEQWRFYTEGPVRFAPVAWQGKLYFGSDDGHLYCVSADSGSLLWRVRGCPGARDDWRHLGNARLISFWPVRGGPVIKEGVVYFAAGIWPTLGVFIVAVNAETGETLWVNGDTGFLGEVRLDHNVLHEAGLSPQGYLLVVGDRLLVPNGRSMPARFHRDTGKMLYYVQGYRNGDCRVTATDEYAFVGRSGMLNLADGREVGSRWAEAGDEAPETFDGSKFHLFEGPFHPYKFIPACDARAVLDHGTAYGMAKGVFYAYDLSRATRGTYEKEHAGHKLEPARWDAPLRWKLATEYAGSKPSSLALIKAGDRLYGHAGAVLLSLDLPADEGEPAVAWTKDLDGTPTSILAADGKLFVVTREGHLYCFGPGAAGARSYPLQDSPLDKAPDQWTEEAAEIIRRAGVSEGYCLVLGLDTGELVTELLRQSALAVIAVDPDPAKVNSLRERLATAGVYGTRAEVFVGDPTRFRFPAYLASLMVSEQPLAAGILSRMPADRLLGTLRPYGGVACLRLPAEGAEAFAQSVADAGLEQVEVERAGRFVLMRRVGALRGSAPWTHESADAARSYASKDDLVRSPLGVLWYGDGDGYGFYKYKDYGTGVKPQVSGGRLFAFQVFSRTLYAVDVYTGRQLWKVAVDPFTRYASMPDGVYVAGSEGCTVHDPATGAAQKTFTYEIEADGPPFVSDLRISDDLIVIAVAFEKERVIEKGLWDSTMLIALDRKTGVQLWTREAEHRFNIHAVAIGEGAVFCVDSVSGAITAQADRRGETPEELPSTIMALDARTGEERWRVVTTNPYRTYEIGHWLGMRGNDDWLAYCEEAKLVLAGKQSEVHGINARTGEEVWHKRIGGGQPIVIQGSTFMTQAGHTFDASNGECLSGERAFTRGGCNYAVANEHLIFVRDRSVCYVDRATGEKHYLRNIRSGCSNSLVAADGLLNAPCFSARCVCNYPIQTSFAMVHMPEVAGWAGSAPLKLQPDPD